MYSFSISKQLWVFLYGLGFGFTLGLFYDTVRLIRRLLTRSNVGVIIQDVLFFSAAAVMTFWFLLVFDMGKLRLYTVLSLTMGFLVWYLSMGGIVLRYFDRGSDLLRGFFSLITRPFRRIASKVGEKTLRQGKKAKNKCTFLQKKFKILLQINKH